MLKRFQRSPDPSENGSYTTDSSVAILTTAETFAVLHLVSQASDVINSTKAGAHSLANMAGMQPVQKPVKKPPKHFR